MSPAVGPRFLVAPQILTCLDESIDFSVWATEALPWRRRGMYPSRMDKGNRYRVLEEALGLTCATYFDIPPTQIKAG